MANKEPKKSTEKPKGAAKPKSAAKSKGGPKLKHAAKPPGAEKAAKTGDLIKAKALITELLKPPQPEDYRPESTSLSILYLKTWYKRCKSLSGMLPDSPHHDDLLKTPPTDDWANEECREDMILTLNEILKWEIPAG